MGKHSGRSWWSSIRFGTKANARDDLDFGDMGTAFGLDASLQAETTPETLGNPRSPSRGDTVKDAPPAARSRR